MRPRVDARVVSALLAESDAVAGEVLATTPSLRSRKEGERHACEAEFASHARALAAAVDLRSPGVFRAHVSWATRLHDASGLPHGSVGACLRALAGRVEGIGLSPDVRSWILRALQAGIAAAEEPVEAGPVDVWDATSAALRGERETYLAAVDDWQEARGTRVALVGIAQVQRQVGEAWERHQAAIVEEHRATGLASMALARMAPNTWAAPGGRIHGHAILAAAPGDFHVVGLEIALHLLELEGYRVELLGADTPAVQLAVACVERKPALVGIGVSAIPHLPAAREAVEMVRHASPSSCIAVGGWAARAAGAPALGADVLVPATFDGSIRAHVASQGRGASAGEDVADAVR
jgi:methanogenic corrinoid protein MtbC1